MYFFSIAEAIGGVFGVKVLVPLLFMGEQGQVQGFLNSKQVLPSKSDKNQCPFFFISAFLCLSAAPCMCHHRSPLMGHLWTDILQQATASINTGKHFFRGKCFTAFSPEDQLLELSEVFMNISL